MHHGPFVAFALGIQAEPPARLHEGAMLTTSAEGLRPALPAGTAATVAKPPELGAEGDRRVAQHGARAGVG